MSTGTGIFLSGLIIGLVMLYGQTKDRWNWSKIFRNLILGLLSLIFIIYQSQNDWKTFQIDFSFKSICVNLILWFCVVMVSCFPMFVLSEFYKIVLDKNFEYDEEGNERKLFTLTKWICGLIFLFVFISYGDSWKDSINVWYDTKFS